MPDDTAAILATIPDPPARISQPAAARKLKLSLNSVARLGESGELRVFTVGRRKFVDARSLADYIARLHGGAA